MVEGINPFLCFRLLVWFVYCYGQYSGYKDSIINGTVFQKERNKPQSFGLGIGNYNLKETENKIKYWC
jgi:hypothetical protein